MGLGVTFIPVLLWGGAKSQGPTFKEKKKKILVGLALPGAVTVSQPGFSAALIFSQEGLPDLQVSTDPQLHRH